KNKKKGFNAEGYILVLGSWPVYTIAFLMALFRIKIPFISTPKEKSHLKENLKLVIPQIITVIILIAGIIYKISNGLVSNPSFSVLFALIMILLHSGVFYTVWESYIFNKKKYSSQNDYSKKLVINEIQRTKFSDSKKVQQKII
ncbi:MAG: hypothetical protein Q7S39_03725, partial [Ignavibacteria bacterium]|nr:hypothetical protein [Ignavibacteria bacterium]